MKKLYILQNSEAEPLGIWQEELSRWHAPFEYIPLWQDRPVPPPESTLAAIVLGGPQNVAEQDRYPNLGRQIEYLQRLNARATPVLGVCLGAQLLAAALGARVNPGPAWEIGYAHVTLTPTGAEDILFSGFPMELPVFQWHRQGFDLPAGALHLAQGRDYPHQAFRHGKAWGFQFHLEVTPDLVDLWAGSRPDELNAADGLTREKLAEQAAASHQVVSLYGRQLIRRFWDALAEL